MSLYDCRQIGSYPTTLPLKRGYVDRMKALEGKDGILSVSAVHCLPYADVEELSGRILVIADGDKAKADALATRLGEEFVSMRGRTTPEYFSMADGVMAAMAFDGHPVVIADPAGNAGGGGHSDNTSILRELMARGAPDRRAPVLRCGPWGPFPPALGRQDEPGLGPTGGPHGRGGGAGA